MSIALSGVSSRGVGLMGLLGAVLFLSGCGSVAQERTTSFDQNTQIALLGNALVGTKITLSDDLNWVVTEEDVQKNRNALLGVRRDSKNSQQMVVLNVQPGLHTLEVRQNGSLRFRGEVYVAEGLTKRVEVPL